MPSMRKAADASSDCQDRAEATSVPESIGLESDTRLELAARQLISERRAPFDAEPVASVQPNEETRQAMMEAEAKESGVLPDDALAFADAASLMSYLDGE